MKKALVYILILSIVTVYGFVETKALGDNIEKEGKKVSIMFTHDLHSNLQPMIDTRDGKTNITGGMAKLKTTVDKVKESYPDSILVDAGDFAMGTAYQTLFADEATELVTMGKVGYDATTIGNHEFDYKTMGLAGMLNRAATYVKEYKAYLEEKEDPSKAQQNVQTNAQRNTQINVKRNVQTRLGNQYLPGGENQDGNNGLSLVDNEPIKMPEIVGTNIDWDGTLKDEKKKKNGQLLKEAFENYGVKEYSIIEKGGVRIAVFGFMGKEAVEDAPLSGVKWEDYVKYAKRVVDKIKKDGKADIIVALSHSGIDEPNGDDAEDKDLAGAVPGIDVIISGHSHSLHKKPIIKGNTIIVSSGSYNKNLGHLVVKKSGEKYKVESYNIIPLGTDVKADETIQTFVDGYKTKIDEKYLGRFSYKYDQVLAKSDFPFTKIENMGLKQGEEPMGSLIADSYIHAVKKAEGGNYKQVYVSVVPLGIIRASFGEGNITVSDVFNVLPLGIGPDGIVGYPLVSVYMTGKEIKTLVEVDASVSKGMPSARLYFSGIKYSFNDKRLYLNRSTDITLVDEGGKKIPLENKKLYRVVGDLYSTQMMGAVSKASGGFLSIEPKDAEGKKITDYNKHIIYDNNKELKTWYALASYMDSFSGKKVPAAYKDVQGRKVNLTGWNPYNLLKQPNGFALALAALILIPIVIITGIVLWIKKRRIRSRGYGTSIFSRSNGGYGRYGGKPSFKPNRSIFKKRR